MARNCRQFSVIKRLWKCHRYLSLRSPIHNTKPVNMKTYIVTRYYPVIVSNLSPCGSENLVFLRCDLLYDNKKKQRRIPWRTPSNNSLCGMKSSRILHWLSQFMSLLKTKVGICMVIFQPIRQKKKSNSNISKEFYLSLKKTFLGDPSMTRNIFQGLPQTLSYLPGDIFFYFT